MPCCVLAPSIDGGLTRRLLAIAPIRAGQALSVPFGASGLDDVRAQLESALAAAGPSHAIAHAGDGRSFVAAAGGGRGRGVFAGRAYASGELVDEWPCVAVPDADVPLGMKDYMHAAPRAGQSLVVLGHGMLYNHHDESNLGWSVPTDAELLLTGAGSVRYFARRDIAEGDELLANYGEGYWRDRGIAPW